MRAFFALDREVVGLREGDGEDESLSLAEAVSAADGCRGMMSSPASRGEGALMLAREEYGSSKSRESFVGAMALYDGSGICVAR